MNGRVHRYSLFFTTREKGEQRFYGKGGLQHGNCPAVPRDVGTYMSRNHCHVNQHTRLKCVPGKLFYRAAISDSYP